MKLHKPCQLCGENLTEVLFLPSLWIAFHQCPKCNQAYLEAGDSRWVYPLQMISAEVLEEARTAPTELLELATERIESIDYKTVSIVAFEETLLGSYTVNE